MDCNEIIINQINEERRLVELDNQLSDLTEKYKNLIKKIPYTDILKNMAKIYQIILTIIFQGFVKFILQIEINLIVLFLNLINIQNTKNLKEY